MPALWLAVLVVLGGVTSARPAQVTGTVRLERVADAMGSLFGVVVYGADERALSAAADAALAEAHRLDGLLSNYRPSSEWSRVNDRAAAEAVVVSAELFDLLAACLEYSRQSQGAFDVTVGPLMRLWGFYKGDGALPPPDAVERLMDTVGYRHVRLDPVARTVRFDRPGVELDPGGIGKGYAVDRMVEVLRRHRIDRALVSAAGSTIYGLGWPPANPGGWPVSIQAPGDPQMTVAEVILRDASLSTSGSYEKFFYAAGRRYAHILDPRTGQPARGVASVSVLAPRAIDSEAWTKPVFVNGREWAEASAPRHFRIFLCAEQPPGDCSWIQ